MKPRILFCFTVMLLASGAVQSAWSQSVDTAWVARYNGPGNSLDWANDIAVDDSGNIYVTGVINWGDMGTIKYYPNGDTAWARSYTGLSGAWGRALAIDDSGNVYVTGETGHYPSQECATVKYYPNGDTAWARRYYGPSHRGDFPYGIAVDASGNVYVAGYSYNTKAVADAFTIKYYPHGDTAWVRRYDGPANQDDFAFALALDDSGNVYVTGGSHGSGTSRDFITIKYLANGDTVWTQRYNGPGNQSDTPLALAIDDWGYIYVTGESYDSLTTMDFTTIKYHPDGDTAWVRRYNGPENGEDRARAIAVDDSGNVVVTGTANQPGIDATAIDDPISVSVSTHTVISAQPRGDFGTVKYYPNGDTAWVRIYNGPGNDVDGANALALDKSGNIYVTGHSAQSNTPPQNFDYATIKYYPDGDEAWAIRYNGPADEDDDAQAIAVDDSGNVYVTGYSFGIGTDKDYATIKYIEIPTEVKGETPKEAKPLEFALSQNCPNPFNTNTEICYQITQDGSVTLKVFNILGHHVRTLVDAEQKAGRYSISWEGHNQGGRDVASGVYFCRLMVGDFSKTIKMVLVR
ncbi:MAG: hypothetical protein AMJ92_08270 [candidate division Zixibacteria bacterium SM23_81]|nr:MAG: hypothetical protein AMJ92_08270 [candidate division Zixibacteria bacterium SM23_81]